MLSKIQRYCEKNTYYKDTWTFLTHVVFPEVAEARSRRLFADIGAAFKNMPKK